MILPESLRRGSNSLVHISFVPLLDLGDDVSGGGVEGVECFAGQAVVPLVIDENAGVLNAELIRRR